MVIRLQLLRSGPHLVSLGRVLKESQTGAPQLTTILLPNRNQWNPTKRRTPSCTDAALEVSTAAATRVLPLYAMLYAFSQLALQQRFDLAATWETSKSIARSSFFIFFHAYNGSVMGCALRRGFGRFYYRVLVCAPALLSSYLSLLIERPARRQALAFYLLNLASEIVFRMTVTKGYFKPIRNGETLLFATSLAAWYYLLKTHGFGHDPVSGAFKVLVGREEAKSRGQHARRAPRLQQQVAQEGGSGEKRGPKVGEAARLVARYCNNSIEFLGKQLVSNGRHASCPHQSHSTCLAYAISPIPSRFLLGYAIQCCLKLASRPMDLIAQPGAAIRQSLVSGASIRFGLFLVSLVSVGRATSCLLRHYSNSNDCKWHGPVSGFAAGLAMVWSPKSSLSMYVMWKAVEQYYLLAASREGKLKQCHNFTVSTIYACSAATILYTFALEPRFVRPSYMKFLDNLSNHRLHQLNRMVLDVFGTGSSVGYEDYFPDLDPKYMSNQFKELVFNWMIQPYE